MIWLVLALAGPPVGAAPAADVLREEAVVAEAAAAVARARGEGQRPARIAELMASYRLEAEKLAAMKPPPDAAVAARERSEALGALTEATARGGAADAARDVVAAWLGPLPARMDLLETALAAAAASPADLAGSMTLDVEAQALAVQVAAAYDAAEADAAARSARTRAAALRASVSPLEPPPLSVELELRALVEQAADAAEAARVARAVGERAGACRDAARASREGP